MTRQILITGALHPKADLKMIATLADSVRDIGPDEIVCFDSSTELLDRLREVHSGPLGVHSGSFDTHHDVRLLPEFYDIAPGWVSTHGHRGGITMGSKIAGNAAMGAARKFGKSVVMGHTHRLGIISETKGYGGKITSQLTGLEVGTLADTRGLKLPGSQQGFGLLTADGLHVIPEARPRK